MNLSDFNYFLPQELIAQIPLSHRDKSKMLVVEKKINTLKHCLFKDLAEKISENYLIVFNNSKVLPAKFYGKKESGGKAEFLFIKSLNNNTFLSLIRSKGNKLNKLFYVQENKYQLKVIANNNGIFTIEVLNNNVLNLLNDVGEMPLPPYIKTKLQNKNRYQNIYAKDEGSVAAPTAGLHFTQTIFEKLKKKKIQHTFLTLHISLDTFIPVKEEEILKHKIHSEEYFISKESIAKIQQAKKQGKKILAVGTTTVRVLETLAEEILNKEPKNCSGNTKLFITPEFKFKVVDSMLTNFHLPKTTLLILVCAFAGQELILQSYQEAIKNKYRFYSFGDCMLII